MSYNDEIKKQLEGLPRNLCIAFAARSVLRVLPLLAGNEKKGEVFWYWDESSKDKHLLAVLIASRFGLAGSVELNKIHSAGDTTSDAYTASGTASGSIASAIATASGDTAIATITACVAILSTKACLAFSGYD